METCAFAYVNTIRPSHLYDERLLAPPSSEVIWTRYEQSYLPSGTPTESKGQHHHRMKQIAAWKHSCHVTHSFPLSTTSLSLQVVSVWSMAMCSTAGTRWCTLSPLSSQLSSLRRTRSSCWTLAILWWPAASHSAQVTHMHNERYQSLSL